MKRNYIKTSWQCSLLHSMFFTKILKNSGSKLHHQKFQFNFPARSALHSKYCRGIGGFAVRWRPCGEVRDEAGSGVAHALRHAHGVVLHLLRRHVQLRVVQVCQLRNRRILRDGTGIRFLCDFIREEFEIATFDQEKIMGSKVKSCRKIQNVNTTTGFENNFESFGWMCCHFLSPISGIVIAKGRKMTFWGKLLHTISCFYDNTFRFQRKSFQKKNRGSRVVIFAETTFGELAG